MKKELYRYRDPVMIMYKDTLKKILYRHCTKTTLYKDTT